MKHLLHLLYLSKGCENAQLFDWGLSAAVAVTFLCGTTTTVGEVNLSVPDLMTLIRQHWHCEEILERKNVPSTHAVDTYSMVWHKEKNE